MALEITDVKTEDGGKYKVLAKNILGELTANINLNVEADDTGGGGADAPIFIEKPKITPQKGGKYILMECRVKSSLKPEVTWFCEGKVVKEGARVKQSIKVEGDDTYLVRLELSDPELGDAGLYRCNFKTTGGEANANLTLNIECKSFSAVFINYLVLCVR